MKNILFNGCSFVYGDELVNKNERFSYIISKHYNIPEINIAKCGSSNERIIRTTIDYIVQKKFQNNICIIGLTDIERREEYLNDDFLDIFSISHRVNFNQFFKKKYTKLKDIIKEKIMGEEYNIKILEYLKIFNSDIKNLHKTLIYLLLLIKICYDNNIKLLIFNAFDDFVFDKTFEYNTSINSLYLLLNKEIIEKNIIIIERSFKNFCFDKNFNFELYGHPNNLCHEKFGKKIIEILDTL